MASKVKRIVCSLIDFFVAVSGKWRRENEVWLEGLCPATVRRKREPRIQLAFYCKCAPFKVSVVLAIGRELNMKGISKWAGRLQTSA